MESIFFFIIEKALKKKTPIFFLRRNKVTGIVPNSYDSGFTLLLKRKDPGKPEFRHSYTISENKLYNWTIENKNGELYIVPNKKRHKEEDTAPRKLKEDTDDDLGKPFLIALIQEKFSKGIPIFLQMRSHTGIATIRYYLSKIEEKNVTFKSTGEVKKRWILTFSPPPSSKLLGDTTRAFMAGDNLSDWALKTHKNKSGDVELELVRSGTKHAL
jgi:hypothetical protein